MASNPSSNDSIAKLPSINQVKPTPPMDIENGPDGPTDDYSNRAQWLRAGVLGANDGLLSVASLMIGVGAVRPDPGTMALTGLAGLFGGACSMALGELVSVWAQRDMELAQIMRDHEVESNPTPGLMEERKRALPSPLRAAAASATAFAAGGGVPLLAAAFIRAYKVRVATVLATVSLALFAFGWVGATLGKAPPMRSSLRVLVGGWVAMGITFGLTKLVGLTGI